MENTSQKLQLTYKELENIIKKEIEGDRFKVLYDDIPKEGHSSDYIEDDGRQYRILTFKDLQTEKEYSFNYVWNREWPLDFPNDLFETKRDDIEFVETSILFPPLPPEPKPLPVRSPEQQADDELMTRYHSLCETSTMSSEPEKSVPKEIVKDLVKFLKTEKFSLYSLRAKVIPVCIEYRTNEKDLWTHLQYKSGAWKKPKVSKKP